MRNSCRSRFRVLASLFVFEFDVRRSTFDGRRSTFELANPNQEYDHEPEPSREKVEA